MKQKQKNIFLHSEGNKWFERNRTTIKKNHFEDNDPIIRAIKTCLDSDASNLWGAKLLEVGCGEGKRLQWIEEHLGLKCYGVEPSEKAVLIARTETIQVIQGTADQLNFENQTFDLVIFGFCLYLCDRDDLFKIAQEADRVLKNTGWLIIHDFFTVNPTNRPYHHLEGIQSYKMDYRKLWDWNPAYICYSNLIQHHLKQEFTDDQDEWVATSVLRKSLNQGVKSE